MHRVSILNRDIRARTRYVNLKNGFGNAGSRSLSLSLSPPSPFARAGNPLAHARDQARRGNLIYVNINSRSPLQNFVLFDETSFLGGACFKCSGAAVRARARARICNTNY